MSQLINMSGVSVKYNNTGKCSITASCQNGTKKYFKLFTIMLIIIKLLTCKRG